MTVPETVHFVLKLLSIFIAVIANIGNVLVCHVIVRLKTMKTSINYIILNLAILDIISGFATIYYFLLNDHRNVLADSILERAYNQSSIFADVLCRIELCYWFPISISPMMLMIMAYERYKAIVDPLSRMDSTVTKARLKWMLPLVWITGISFNAASIVQVRYHSNLGYCFYRWYNFEYFLILWVITLVIMPSIAMLVFYARGILSLRRQDKTLGSQAEAERVRRKASKNVMRTIIAVTVVFYLFCGIPQLVSVCASSFFIDLKVSLLGDVLIAALTVNLVFNPCAYFIFIQSFRDGFRRVFCTRKAARNSLRVSVGFRSVVGDQGQNLSSEERQKDVPQLLTFNISQSNRH